MFYRGDEISHKLPRTCLGFEDGNINRRLPLRLPTISDVSTSHTNTALSRHVVFGRAATFHFRCLGRIAGVLPQCDWAGDDFEWSKPMAELSRDTFGLNSWRINQKEIINATLSRRDVFVVMRTGGGKSLCYQLPALLQGGITVGGLVLRGCDTHVCIAVLRAHCILWLGMSVAFYHLFDTGRSTRSVRTWNETKEQVILLTNTLVLGSTGDHG